MATSQVTRFNRLLTKNQHVGLDTMCFIYHFAAHPKYVNLTQSLFSLLESNQLQASTSMISVIETLVLPEQKIQPELVTEYLNVFENFPNLTVVPVDYQMARLTAKLRAAYPTLRVPDVIQISAALLNKCNIFITNDKKLKAVKQIKVCLLSDYV